MASNQSVTIQPRPNVKQINYVAKTFTDFRQNLIDFAKAYYPNAYSDFNETSPGMMFIEMASYVGDVLSFYIDNAFKENLLAYAEQQENVTSIAQFLGYKPKLTSPATTTATLYQLAPAKIVNGEYVPDTKFLIKIGRGSTFLTSGQNTNVFRLVEDIDFSDITAEDYIVNTFDSGNPSTFIVSKPAKLVAAAEKLTTFSFGAAQRFTSVTITDDNVIGIESVVDSNGNTWYEVDYLAQEVIMDDVEVTTNNETGILPSSKLRLRKVPRRFVTRINRNSRMELIFGSGTNNDAEVNTTLDSRQVATSQYGSTIETTLGNVAINNVNFLNSNTYGTSPSNTTLTVRYLVGGGVESNTPSNTINIVGQLITQNDTTGYTTPELNAFNAAVQSISINNDLPATGGGNGESLDEIRENALAFFNAQNRTVTVEDYAVRSYALPSRFGRIAKAYAVRDEQINRILSTQSDRVYVDNPVRPNVINLYTLGYDTNGKLTTLNTVVKENLARYLEQFRMLTDDVNILDAFIINIGVQFDISVLRNYNVNDVLARSIGSVQDFFNTSKWNINQPIILADLMYNIGLVEGVQNVKSVSVFNKYQYKDGTGYQNYRYDIDEATINGVIYPSLDPSIFELKYPTTDIIGNATQ
jgi:hypothetical protein